MFKFSKKPKKLKKFKIKKYNIRSKDREYFTSNMSILLRASVPIGEALQSLMETTKKGPFKSALVQMEHDINQGTPLWKALERCGIASQQTLTLVQFGETSGNLVENLDAASKQEQKQNMFKSKVRSAMMYPAFVLVLTLVVGLGVAWFLLPRLSNTFSQLDVELPLISKILIGFGLFLSTDGYWFIPSSITGVLVVGYIVFLAPKTREIGQFVLFHTPGVGRLIREIEIARFGYLLGSLLAAGISIVESFELLEKASSNTRYKKLYRYLEVSFRDGYSLRESLKKYKRINKLMPPSVQQMVVAGERSGALSTTLLSVGQIYEEKADLTTDNLEVIIEPFMLIVVAGGVLAVAIAVILPIYSLVGGLGG